MVGMGISGSVTSGSVGTPIWIEGVVPLEGWVAPWPESRPATPQIIATMRIGTTTKATMRKNLEFIISVSSLEFVCPFGFYCYGDGNLGYLDPGEVDGNGNGVVGGDF
jgi:hypothetical protein